MKSRVEYDVIVLNWYSMNSWPNAWNILLDGGIELMEKKVESSP